ncbi:MAG: GAF domain-containing protein [Actinomycetia bacterium]|nr:GAF domain-containing protein [Actinomycetes bacterium]
MARVALVSRNPDMSMAFSASDHSVAEIRPSGLDDWLAGGEDVGVDVLVLDLGSPKDAQRVVGDLRAQGRWVPVLLVAASDPAWSESGVTSLPGVELLPLPLDPERLKIALAAALRHPRTPPAVKTAAPSDPLLEDVPELDLAPAPELLREEESTPPVPSPERERLLEPEPELVTEPNPEPEPEQAPEPFLVSEPAAVPVPAHAPRKPRSAQLHKHSALKSSDEHPVSSIRLDPSEPLPSVAPAAPEPEPEPISEFSAGDPMHWLLEEAESYYTLEEIAKVIVEDAVVRGLADAGALLVPDGALWRVAAGVGLRPLEHRLQLLPEAWIVDNVATAGKGVLIQDSDVARLDLRGTPLASRNHLMAVPVPIVRAVLILSRDGSEPFTERSLSSLVDLADEAGPLIEQAVDLRTLARLLAEHLNQDQTPTA